MEYTIPNEYDIPNVNNDVPAQYCDAPEHMNIDDNLENTDLNQYWDQPVDERDQAIQDGMGAGPETNVEQYPESEFADNCDPPDHLSDETEQVENTSDDLNSDNSFENTDDVTSGNDTVNEDFGENLNVEQPAETPEIEAPTEPDTSSDADFDAVD